MSTHGLVFIFMSLFVGELSTYKSLPQVFQGGKYKEKLSDSGNLHRWFIAKIGQLLESMNDIRVSSISLSD